MPDVALAERLRAVGRAAGLDALGFAEATPFTSTRDDLEQRKAAGLHGGMQFTYRDPARSTDPGRILAGARSLVVGRPLVPARRPATGRVRPDGAGGRVRLAGPLRRPAGRRSAEVADVLGDEGWRARVVLDDNALVDREAAVRAGLGWYGTQQHGAAAGAGQRVRPRLGGHRRRPARRPTERVPDGCGPCHRCVDACPTGAIVAPGVIDARRCLAWLVQATGEFPVEHREALGDRIYGCDDCQDVCPVNRRSAARRPPAEDDARDRVDLRRPAGGGRRHAAGRVRPLVRPPAGSPLPASQRARCPGQHGGTGRRPGRGRDRAVRARVTTSCWPSTPAGPAERARGVKHLLVTNDFPPKVGGIQSYLWELWRRLATRPRSPS